MTFLSQLQANTMKCLRLFCLAMGQISGLFVGSLLSRDGLTERWRAGLALSPRSPLRINHPSIAGDCDIEKEIDIQTGDAPAGPY